MQPRTEVEYKLALPDDQALARLKRILVEAGAAVQAPLVQVNHFFDTAERDLRGHELALRLRSAGGRHELALKGPATTSAGAALHERPEEELELDARAAAAILAGERSPLELLRECLGASALNREAGDIVGGRTLRHIGAFENERTRLGPVVLAERGPALVLELDRTRFPGGRIELELEVEIRAGDAADVAAALRDLLRRARVEWRPARSKAERFFRILDGAQEEPGGRSAPLVS